jgi:hypothetical protein
MKALLCVEYMSQIGVNGFPKEGTKYSSIADLDISQHQNQMKIPER